LRHSGQKAGLKFSPDGFTPLADVLKLKDMVKLGATAAIVREVVNGNDKQRFKLVEDSGTLLIRANQGHSMDGINMDELCGSPISALKDGEVCCHGTYERHLESILREGLKSGGSKGETFRKDIHFSIRDPGQEVISGMRQSSQIAIYVDLPRAAQDGIAFYRSANDVILSAGINGAISSKYFKSVWNIKKQEQIFFEPQEDGASSGSALAPDLCREAAGGNTPFPGSACGLCSDELTTALSAYTIGSK